LLAGLAGLSGCSARQRVGKLHAATHNNAASRFVAAVFITSLLAAFASFKMKPVSALVLAVALTIFSTAVFSYGLGLPFERFGPWLRG